MTALEHYRTTFVEVLRHVTGQGAVMLCNENAPEMRRLGMGRDEVLRIFLESPNLRGDDRVAIRSSVDQAFGIVPAH